MFIGHYGVGFAAKKLQKGPSLAMLFIAVQFLDLVWPVLVLLGIESFVIEPGNTALTPLHFTHYPWSHSLLMAFVWGAFLALCYYFFTKNRQGSLLLGGLVVSHWVLDLVVHAPDLPLTPFGEARFGFGLWNYPVIAVIIELCIFVLGVYWYYTTMRPARKKVFWSLIALFLVTYFANIFGPPPPSVTAVAWSANLMWLTVFLAWWVERPVQKGE